MLTGADASMRSIRSGDLSRRRIKNSATRGWRRGPLFSLRFAPGPGDDPTSL
jgi:hypothetical protein